MKVYYFGCLNEIEHYLYLSRGDRTLPDKETPWGFEMDAGLTPKGPREQQGHVLITHKEGWTAMSWWDRTVDTRPGCNSAVLAEGEHDFQQMKSLLKEHWQEVHDRQPVELFLS